MCSFMFILAIVPLAFATPLSKYDHKLEYIKWSVKQGNTSIIIPVPVPTSGAQSSSYTPTTPASPIIGTAAPSTIPAPISANSSSTAEQVWQVKLGDICQITRFPLPSGEPTRYLECVRPSNNETEWPWLDKGIWVLKLCPAGLEYHLLSQTCRSRRYIRRQQSICATNPTAQYCPQPQQPQYSIQPQQQQQQMMCQCPPGINVCACPQPTVLQPQPQQQQVVCPPMPCPQQPCPTPQISIQQYCPQPPQPCPLAPQGAANAREGDLCSWMLAPLAADQGNNKCFLQCVPAPGNAFCGRWVRMPCAPATIFDVNVQVCVHDPYNVPGPVPGWSAANNPLQTMQQQSCNIGTNIGACNSNFQCPGQSVCQVSQPQSQQCQQQPQTCSTCCYTGGVGAQQQMGGMGGQPMMPNMGKKK